MSDNDWVKPIALRDYASFVSDAVEISGNKINLREAKDSASDTGYCLRAKVKMTFAGLRTANRALYLPNEMYAGLRTFIHPFPKPVLTHHDEDSDPIGRIIDVRYVDTTKEASVLDSRVLDSMSKFSDKSQKLVEKLKATTTFLSLSQNEKYRGIGHAVGLWNITDPEAIRKVLDSRYLTVSTHFKPKGAYCSACAREGKVVDWKVSTCDHERGDVVDGVECVAIPFGFEYKEASFVNNPAAVHAQVLEFGEGLSFEDAVARTRTIPYEIISDVVIGTEKEAFRCLDSATFKLPSKLSDYELSTLRTPSRTSRPKTTEQDNSMTIKLSQLVKDSASNYEEVVKHLPEGTTRLTGDLLSSLEDSVFIGHNRTFPVKDAVHGQAIKSLLDALEDSDSKTELLSALDAKMKSFEQPIETEEPVVEEIKDEETETPAEESKDSTPLHEQLLQELVNAAKSHFDKILSAKTPVALKEALDGMDSIYDLVYAMRRTAGVIAAADSLEDAAKGFLDSVKDAKDGWKKDEEKLSLADALASKFEDAVAEKDLFKHRVDSLKSEIASLTAHNNDLLKEQKTTLAEKLLDAQINLGIKCEDREAKLVELSKRSVQSLRDSISDLSSQKKEDSGIANTPSGEKAPNPIADSEKVEETEKDEEIDTSKFAHIVDRYFDLFYSSKGRRGADEYLVKMKGQGLVPKHYNP